LRNDEYNILQVSESSALIEFGEIISKDINKKIRAVCNYLDNNNFYGFVEYVPYFCSISIIYNPLVFKNEPRIFNKIKEILEDILRQIDVKDSYEDNIVEIPVCYGGKFGMDLEYVAKAHGIKSEEVIDIHSKGQYLVYMIGFTPGFPYLGGLDERLHTERRESPRGAIKAGSVGIAGMQTGVYPIETPGGWQIIGRTPLKLFDLSKDKKTLLKCGDIVKFKSISEEEYLKIEENLL